MASRSDQGDAPDLLNPQVDVGARIGWLLRTARLRGGITLEEMARATGSNLTRLHRIETGKARSGGLIDGYERALGLAGGTLRAPVDVMCRTFPESPLDRDPGSDVTTVRQMSALTEKVESAQAAGGDWLAFARAISQPGAIGLPERLARPLLGRLMSEVSRAVGTAYATRYEALALLRCGPYGAVVVGAARSYVEDPRVQVLYDVMSGVGEVVSDDAIAWCLGLLREERDQPMIGAALALENMATITDDPGFWTGVLDDVVRAYNVHPLGSAGWEWCSHLLRLVPRAQLDRLAVRPLGKLAPAAQVKKVGVRRTDAWWAESHERAHPVAGTTGLSAAPMLARLIYDIAFSPFESRAVTSFLLLSALPDVSAAVAEQVAAVVDDHDDPVIAERARRRLMGANLTGDAPFLHAWLRTPGATRSRALRVAANAGIDVADAVVLDAVAGEDRDAALYWAGMAGSPLLQGWSTEADVELRDAAGWWLEHGSRVVH